MEYDDAIVREGMFAALINSSILMTKSSGFECLLDTR